MKVTFDIPSDLWQELLVRAHDQGKTSGDVILDTLREAFGSVPVAINGNVWDDVDGDTVSVFITGQVDKLKDKPEWYHGYAPGEEKHVHSEACRNICGEGGD